MVTVSNSGTTISLKGVFNYFSKKKNYTTNFTYFVQLSSCLGCADFFCCMYNLL